jgi:hypothetical protein
MTARVARDIAREFASLRRCGRRGKTGNVRGRESSKLSRYASSRSSSQRIDLAAERTRWRDSRRRIRADILFPDLDLSRGSTRGSTGFVIG